MAIAPNAPSTWNQSPCSAGEVRQRSPGHRPRRYRRFPRSRPQETAARRPPGRPRPRSPADPAASAPASSHGIIRSASRPAPPSPSREAGSHAPRRTCRRPAASRPTPSLRTDGPSSADRATSTPIRLAIEVPVTSTPEAFCGEPQHLGGPGDNLSLHFDRRMIASAEVCVQPAGQHLRQHAHRVAAAMHPAHEARMQVAGRIGLHQALEILIDRFRRRWVPRQISPQFLAQLRRHRAPDRVRRASFAR